MALLSFDQDTAIEREDVSLAASERSAARAPSSRPDEASSLPPELGGRPTEIGSGGQAVIYRLADGRVAKVFRSGSPDVAVEHEFRAAAAARACGVPTWTVESFSVDGPERCIIGSFEAGVRLSVVLRRRPHEGFRLMRRLAVVHAGIHRIALETSRHWRSQSGGEARALRPFLPARTIDRLNSVIATSEIGFGHGDLAPRNVLCRADDIVVLDWGRSGLGPMTADAGHTCMMVMSAPFGLTPARLQLRYRAALVDAYISAYETETGRSASEIRVWTAISLARKAAGLPAGRRQSAVAFAAERWAHSLAD